MIRVRSILFSLICISLFLLGMKQLVVGPEPKAAEPEQRKPSQVACCLPEQAAAVPRQAISQERNAFHTGPREIEAGLAVFHRLDYSNRTTLCYQPFLYSYVPERIPG